MQNFRMTLSYDGTRYRGWQKQGNTPNTLQEKMEATLSRLLGQPVEVNGSGRTDAGVHARMQVCSFRADTEKSPEELRLSLNRCLPEDIGCTALEKADPRFHARLSCREKTYLYRIWRGTAPDVFEHRFRWAFPDKLDMRSMLRAAELMCGTHDLTAFTSARKMKKSAVRTVNRIRFEEEENELRIFFTGDGFLYNTVRIMTGTLLEAGTGKRDPESIPQVFASQDRQCAGFTAPPQGLILWEVRY